MASRIITKKGSGAPLASDLVHGELAVDTVNKRLYTENAGGTIIELGTAPSTIDINAGTIDGTVIGGSSAAAGSFTTISASGEIAANGGVAFGDNDKAIFGASDDLEIYHDGSNSWVADKGTGDLYVATNGHSLYLYDQANAKTMAQFVAGGASRLHYDNAIKIATTSTGIDVTGTVTADGLTVDGVATISSATPLLIFSETDAVDLNTRLRNTGGDFIIERLDDNGATQNTRIRLEHDTGDISFYNNSNAQKLFWDASAESLGIGTTSPASQADISKASGGDSVLSLTSAGVQRHQIIQKGTGDGGLVFYNQTAGAERMRIDSSGNLLLNNTTSLIGTNTSDGSDNKSVMINGGGSASDSRGAYVWAKGNEHSDAGKLQLNAGNVSGAPIAFHTSGSERMRIDSSGNLLVGNTVTNPSSNYSNQRGFAYINSTGKVEIATTANDVVMDIGKNNANDGSLVAFRKQGTIVGSISVTGSTTAYNITSDERLKENIVDTTHTVDINDIKVRQYDWKSNGEHQRYGFIAQELEAVYPEAVFSPEDPEEMKAVDYSKLVPLLVKEIQDLKAEVAALKGA